MAQLLLKPSSQEGEWTVRPIDTDAALALDERGAARSLRRCDVLDGLLRAPDGAVLLGVGGAGERWLLVARAGVDLHVNDRPVSAGTRVLRDKDEIRLGAGAVPIFFSTERVARIEPFEGSGVAASCPRCRLPLEAGAPAVRCPSCGVAHHQREGLLCWTYAESCAVCGHPTPLDAELQWVPEAV